ncbi:18814_t:CDS:2 [Acaulospora morrowiae]|uniref:DNA-directed RNA polymerase III subunit RPC9 n=1 Tax=Acaulospora morrowiae TaxID=94023 RepID=A0A9N9I659_9GLOM|nr:18814_t:CDS:2 [Acaulospora morrowiae]
MLSNYEVLAVLREMDDKQKDQARANPNIKFAENLKTIQFESPASTQTPEQIESILDSLKKYNLTKSEKLQIINLRPQNLVDLELIIEDCEDRFQVDTLREMIYVIGTKLPMPGKVVHRLEGGQVNLDGDETMKFIHYPMEQ